MEDMLYHAEQHIQGVQNGDHGKDDHPEGLAEHEVGEDDRPHPQTIKAKLRESFRREHAPSLSTLCTYEPYGMSALSLASPAGGLALGRFFDFGAAPSFGLLLSLALLTHLVPGIHAAPAAAGGKQGSPTARTINHSR